MTHAEFEALRKLPGKTISDDIRFVPPRKDATPEFEVGVSNSLGINVRLVGRYNPDIPSLAFNFHLGASRTAICRLDINGSAHKDVGRTHKHELRNETDMRRNLPFALSRRDYEGMTPGEVWNKLCREAGIVHTGTFVDPEENRP